ncbi:MAG: DUF5011 domain-containing protein [bacterium]
MKKIILSITLFATVLITHAQVWTPTAVRPLPDSQVVNVSDFTAFGTCVYVTMSNAGKTTVVKYDTVLHVLDTLPGGALLPINSANVFIGPDTTLWVVGAGVGCDSVIWKTSLATGNPPPLQNVWGPHRRPNPGKYAWVNSVGFLNGDVYFAGRFDSVGNNKIANLVRYSNQAFYQLTQQQGLVNFNVNGASNSVVGARIQNFSKPGELMVTLPKRLDSVLVITSANTGYIEVLNSTPVQTNGAAFIDPNIIAYRGDVYYAIQDYDSNSVITQTRIVKKHQQTFSVVAQLDSYLGNANFLNDWGVVSGKIVMALQPDLFTDGLTGQRLYPVMAFDSVRLTPVIDSFVNTIPNGYAFTKIKNGILFGRRVIEANKVTGYGFYRITYSDTTAPVITLIGTDTIVVHKGSVFTNPGATASDNEDGDITSSIVVTGVVDTGTLGTYTITYTVTDAAGNTASITRVVIVDHPNGISNLDNSEMIIRVYPDRFVVSEVTTPATVRVFTTSGQQVSEFGIMHQGMFSYTGLSSGIYIASVGSKNFRFVVQ